MPAPTAIPPSAKDEDVARRRRFQIAKIAVASLFVLVLLYLGFQGSYHARAQAKLDDIIRVRNQLESAFEHEQGLPERFADGLGNTNTIAIAKRAVVSTPQARTLLNTLQTLLREFYYKGKLSAIEDLELRLSQATLANAEQRFADALSIITDQDEQGRPRTEAQLSRILRVLQIRGDALCGLRKWEDALERYRDALRLQPDRVATIARVAECQAALGKRDEALLTYGELAKVHAVRGDARLLQGNPDSAIRHYQRAIQIQTNLVSQQGSKERPTAVARSYNNRGDAFLFQGKADAAIADFDSAIRILTPLIDKERPSDSANELAMSHHNRGNVFLTQRKWDAASEDLEEAIRILTPLVEKGAPAMADELARNHNNLGVVRRAQRRPDAAINDFEKAIAILTPLIEQAGRAELASDGPPELKVEAAMGYSENALEALVRTRRPKQGRRSAMEILLAVSLKNRGYAHLVQGHFDRAMADFKQAIAINTRLVEREGQRDLVPEYARSLTSIAWVYATSPDDSSRDGGKAKGYALKACELSEWNSFGAIEALAAASAETGNFNDAIKWQLKAFELAPAKYKAEIAARLHLYQAGKPYRSQPPV